MLAPAYLLHLSHTSSFLCLLMNRSTCRDALPEADNGQQPNKGTKLETVAESYHMMDIDIPCTITGEAGCSMQVASYILHCASWIVIEATATATAT
ncbi:hypothetical protein ACLKA6_018871 [Drosophila palustris]